ncbi:phosphate-starvation-inducible PsiE family protein [Sulfurimonas sp.]|nr:phosphate-starvation-inducible PsiE family protein [Sulfurimonas sp.]
MNNFKNFFKLHYQVIIASIIFSSFIFFSYPLTKLIVLMLEFIIVLEVVKMISEFITNGKIRLRHIIDGFIIFIIRDIVVNLSHEEKDKETILFLSLMVLIFFVFRILSIMISPSKYRTSSKL